MFFFLIIIIVYHADVQLEQYSLNMALIHARAERLSHFTHCIMAQQCEICILVLDCCELSWFGDDGARAWYFWQHARRTNRCSALLSECSGWAPSSGRILRFADKLVGGKSHTNRLPDTESLAHGRLHEEPCFLPECSGWGCAIKATLLLFLLSFLYLFRGRTDFKTSDSGSNEKPPKHTQTRSHANLQSHRKAATSASAQNQSFGSFRNGFGKRTWIGKKPLLKPSPTSRFILFKKMLKVWDISCICTTMDSFPPL